MAAAGLWESTHDNQKLFALPIQSMHSRAGPAGDPLALRWKAGAEQGLEGGGLHRNIPPGYFVLALVEAPVLQGEAFSYLVEPVGGSIQLHCVVRGDPAPDIHWTKDGLPLPISSLYLQLQNGSLTILRTKARRGSALYSCLEDL